MFYKVYNITKINNYSEDTNIVNHIITFQETFSKHISPKPSVKMRQKKF